jgi:hypothetical protein
MVTARGIMALSWASQRMGDWYLDGAIVAGTGQYFGVVGKLNRGRVRCFIGGESSFFRTNRGFGFR